MVASARTAGLSAEALLQDLRTDRFGRAMRLLAETASTSDVAWEWLRSGGPEGGVVIAERQTRGRGRHGRAWASPRGGLWMSVAVRPEMEMASAGRLGVGLAIATAEAVRAEAGCDVGLKWPNDVVLGGRKLGGVLVETESDGGRVGAAVLSLGLNVNSDVGMLPEQVRREAVSLLGATGRRHRVERIAGRVLEGLEGLWPDVVGAGTALAERWRAWDVLHGREVSVDVGGETRRGRANGIDSEGALVLMIGGAAHRMAAGEVRSVRGAQR